MEFKINGESYRLDTEAVGHRLRGWVPEPIQVHWVEMDGVRFPVKQALERVLGVSRTRFTSHIARSVFARLGLPTGPVIGSVRQASRRPSAAVGASTTVTAEQAGAAFATLVAYLRGAPFSAGISALEYNLLYTDRATASAVTSAAGLTEELLRAALIVRRDVGRASDVIHAAVICLALSVILEEDEIVVNRPSLGAGNDPSRPFDLETNRRVAEFKVAVWSGGDMMRKRTVTADLVHLALDESGRRPELWVAGEEPLEFLLSSTMSIDGLLSRSSRILRARFESRYGTGAIPLRDFTAEHAPHVRLCNIADVLPAVASALL